jgi:hypothetical protein
VRQVFISSAIRALDTGNELGLFVDKVSPNGEGIIKALEIFRVFREDARENAQLTVELLKRGVCRDQVVSPQLGLVLVDWV